MSSVVCHNLQVTELYKKIKAARQNAGLTQAQLGELCGVTRAAVSLWESRESRGGHAPKIENLHLISKHTGAPISWLLDEKQDLDSNWLLKVGESPVEYYANNFVLIKHYKGFDHKGYLMFSSDWINSHKYIEDSLLIFTIDDSNMAPTIPPNNIVMVNRGEQNLEHNQIYAFNLGESVVFKRIKKSFKGDVSLVDDNLTSTSEPEKFPKDQADKLPVIGRAVWTAGNL